MEVRVLRRAIGWLHSSRLNYSMPLAKAGVRCVVGAGGLECEWFLAFRLPNIIAEAFVWREGWDIWVSPSYSRHFRISWHKTTDFFATV